MARLGRRLRRRGRAINLGPATAVVVLLEVAYIGKPQLFDARLGLPFGKAVLAAHRDVDLPV